jgi:Transglycosylase SLT domain
VSTAKGNTAGKEQRRARRRRRKMAAATGTMLLVAAAVAGEPVTGGSMPLAGGVGGGLYGMTDPDSVSANGEVGEEDRIGDEVLKSAGNIDRLRQLGPAGDLPNGPLMIPADLYKAYTNAALMLATELPSCKIHWSLLASIGRIESNHARGGQVDAAGNTVPHILGPVLNGGGFAAIRDTDGGRLDDDARWDRAVGSMQFIPSTWRGYAADGNNDGISSPHNIYDATVAAGKYLCSGGLDLSNPQDKATAVFRYNHSDSYVRTVLIWADAYAKGTHPLPSDLGPSPAELAAMNPPVALPGGAKPAKPKPGTSTTTRTTIVTPPPSSSSPTTTPPSCGPSTTPTTSTTTTTPPSSPPSTTTTPGCPPSSSTPPPSSSASEGSTSVTPTSAAPSSSAPAGEAGSSVAATS